MKDDDLGELDRRSFIAHLVAAGVVLPMLPACTESPTGTRADAGPLADALSGRGAIQAPYKSVKYALEYNLKDGDGMVVMLRGGTSHEFWLNNTSSASHWPSVSVDLQQMTFSPSSPLLIRNYPGENHTNDCQHQGTSYVAAGKYCIVYGLHCINTGIPGGTSGVGMQANGNGILKLCTAKKNRAHNGNNPSAIRLGAGAMAFGCVAADSYDPGSVNNSQDFMIYMDVGSGGDTYVIDCISEGAFDGRLILTGMRVKHCDQDWNSTDNLPVHRAHYHRCVAVANYQKAFGIGVGDTVRHCVVAAGLSKSVAFTTTVSQEGSKWPANLAHPKYYVVQGCLAVAKPGERAIVSNWFNGFADSGLIYNNEFDFASAKAMRVDGTASGFEGGEWRDNILLGPTDTGICVVTGSTFDLAEMNSAPSAPSPYDKCGGSGNAREVFSTNLVKVVADHVWTWNGKQFTKS